MLTSLKEVRETVHLEYQPAGIEVQHGNKFWACSREILGWVN